MKAWLGKVEGQKIRQGGQARQAVRQGMIRPSLGGLEGK
jgi:hypothetical protein